MQLHDIDINTMEHSNEYKCDVVATDEDSQVEYHAEYQHEKIFCKDGSDLILERVEDCSLMNIRS